MSYSLKLLFSLIFPDGIEFTLQLESVAEEGVMGNAGNRDVKTTTGTAGFERLCLLHSWISSDCVHDKMEKRTFKGRFRAISYHF